MTRRPGSDRDDAVRRDVDDEIAFHLEMRTEELIAAGAAPAEAAARARREFGDLTSARKSLGRAAARHGRRLRWRETAAEIVRDGRHGLRSLRNAPRFTATALLMIALGIGAATSIFTVLDAVLLRPLGYARDGAIVRVYETRLPEIDRNVVSRGNYLDWRDRSSALESWGAYMLDFGYGLTGQGDPLQVTGSVVSPGVFRALGVAPVLGRSFGGELEGPEDEVLLSHGLWRSRFAADPAVIGQRITLDGDGYTVIGVMAPSFEFPTDRTDVWLPMRFSPADRQSREAHMLHVVARLRPGVALGAARAEMEAVSDGIAREHPAEMTGWGVRIEPFRSDLVRSARPLVLLLFAGVVLVLLIACANVANLLLVRGAGRSGEMAVRSALGAGRGRLVRQLLAEHAVLGVAGGAAAVPVAWLLTRALVGLAPAEVPLVDTARLDPSAMLFAATATLASVLIFGVAPAVRTARADLQSELRTAGAWGGGRSRARGALLVAQVALAVVLLVSAGLLVRSFSRMHAVDPGFEPDGLLLASMNLPATSYRGTAAHVAFYDAVLERVRALPGVTAAAGTSEPPLVGFRMTRDIVVEGHSFAPDERPDVEYRAVTADFFSTLRIPINAGRPLTAADDANGAPVIVVNEAFARRFWPAGGAVGRRVRLDDLPHEIVGVAGDVRQAGLDAPEQPVIYAPYAQKDWTWLSWMSLVVRVTGDPLDLAAPLRRAVWDVDPLLPIHEIAAIETLYHADAADRRFAMVLMAAFALAGLALGAVGTYGVVAFAVAGRTREIGVRVALGAGRGRILALVVREGLRFAAAGVAIGLFGAFVAARLLGGLLFGVRPDDPLTFACVAVLTAAVAIAATLPAGVRAARIDAGRTLRGG